MKSKKIILGIGIIILMLISGIVLAAEPITPEKEAAINQLLQQRADEVQGADNIIEYISIQDIGTAAQTKYNDPAKGYEVIQDTTKQKIAQAQQRMLTAAPRIWTITDSLTLTPQQKQEQQPGGKGISITTILFILVIGGGLGFLGTKKLMGRRKEKEDVDPTKEADMALNLIKEGIKKAGIQDIIRMIEAKQELIKKNQESIENLFTQISIATKKLEKFGGAPIHSYQTGTSAEFNEIIKKFWKEIGLTNEEIALLTSIKEGNLARTEIGTRMKKIQEYNEELSKTSDKNLALTDKQIGLLKSMLMQENNNINGIERVSERIDSVLKMERGGIVAKK